MATCPNCSAEFDGSAKFCSTCGSPMSTEASSAEMNMHENETNTSQGEISFFLNGKTISFPSDVDRYLEYVEKFKQFAKEETNSAIEEYRATVNDFETFATVFPEIYDKKLSSMIDKAIEALISQGVYDITPDAFRETFVNAYHVTMDHYQEALEMARGAGSSSSGLFNSIAEQTASKGGVGGMLGGLFAQGIANSIAQQSANNVLEKLPIGSLFQMMFTELFAVSNVLTLILNRKGCGVACPSSDGFEEVAGVLVNISNPSFPADKADEILIDLVQKYPFEEKVYAALEARYGITPEISKMKDYFVGVMVDLPNYENEEFQYDFTSSASSANDSKDVQNDDAPNEKKVMRWRDVLKGSGDIKEDLKRGATLGIMTSLGKSMSEERKGKQDYFGSVHCKRAREKTKLCSGCSLEYECSHRKIG